MKAIEKGKKNRHIGKTNMNEHSSRSHSVVQLRVEQVISRFNFFSDLINSIVELGQTH